MHTTPKGRSKAEYITHALATLDGGARTDAVGHTGSADDEGDEDGAGGGVAGAVVTALFVDDSAAEVCDAQVVANARVFRILFQRGTLT